MINVIVNHGYIINFLNIGLHIVAFHHSNYVLY